ncbi:hypothetical protein BACPEC_00957 [[Bacteroides] pectinophilus ATCC 43243]|uniref:Uncharacterized protein n=1 Tax=[Bacteroides] pectinophilus ATCC 43243 TaxID=483218 RepID=B7AQK0_9FIRM|nr:hypothetical protein BACPEC_00957 [[Bacteroides] pectinophilus ATCC 43243]
MTFIIQLFYQCVTDFTTANNYNIHLASPFLPSLMAFRICAQAKTEL